MLFFIWQGLSETKFSSSDTSDNWCVVSDDGTFVFERLHQIKINITRVFGSFHTLKPMFLVINTKREYFLLFILLIVVLFCIKMSNRIHQI